VSAQPVRLDARVLENRAESGPNRRLRLGLPSWPGCRPGQFVMLSPGARSAVERSDPLLPRPMAVYRQAPLERDGEAALEILYKITGRGTALLADALPGQTVRVVGPLGVSFPEPEPGERVLLVGGGTGIASLYLLAERLGARAEACVLLGARTADDLMGREDFAALGPRLEITTEDGSEGEPGLVTDALARELAQPGRRAVVFACGPTPMMRRCAELARDAGARCIVSLENRMACGFGVCLGCAAPVAAGGYALVCCQGPVFDAARLRWEGLP
jgi:dihydroorotate dehydrogenase electron transfer subunit